MTHDALSLITRAALDGLYLRQAATAHNIANHGSPGFVPQRVEFEAALRELADTLSNGAVPAAVSTARLVPQTVPAGVALDLEVATASETALRYTALVESVDRLMGLQRLAIRGE